MCLTYSFVRNNNKEFALSRQSDFTASERKAHLSNQEVEKKYTSCLEQVLWVQRYTVGAERLSTKI